MTYSVVTLQDWYISSALQNMVCGMAPEGPPWRLSTQEVRPSLFSHCSTEQSGVGRPVSLAGRYSSQGAVLCLRGVTGILARLLLLSFSKLDLKVIKMFIERPAFTSDSDSELLLIRVPSSLLSR